MEPSSHGMQDIFISSSEIYFENKWDPVEVFSKNNNFIEFTPGSHWSESIIHDANSGD